MESERALDLAQKLIAKAESTTHEAERDAFLAKAHAIMEAHALDMLSVLGRPKQASEKMIDLRVPMVTANLAWLRDPFIALAGAVAKHCRCRLLIYGANNSKWFGCDAGVFGLESDAEYFNTLFTSLRLHALECIDPKYDPAQTLQVNVYNMKTAGLAWKTIAHRCGFYDSEAAWDKTDSRWINWYKRECKLRGEKPIGSNPKNYQYNFIDAYANRINSRLAEIRRLRDETTHGEYLPALRDLSDKVNEAFRDAHPNLHSIKPDNERVYNSAAAAQGTRTANTADLGLTKVGNRRRELE